MSISSKLILLLTYSSHWSTSLLFCRCYGADTAFFIPMSISPAVTYLMQDALSAHLLYESSPSAPLLPEIASPCPCGR